MKTREVINLVFPFRSKTEIVLEATDVSELYSKAIDKILGLLAVFQMRGSGWRFKAVQRLEINSIAYKPLKSKSYIPLPTVLANKKAIINLKNGDDQCFKWCVARALNLVDDHAESITKVLRY